MKPLIFRIINKIRQDTKIVNKVIVFNLLLIFIPLLLMTLFINNYFQGVVKTEAISSYKMVVNQYIGIVQYKLKEYNNLIDNITHNSTIREVFNTQNNYNQQDTVNLSRLISNTINYEINEKNPEEIYNIVLYAMSPNFPSDGSFISNIKYIEDSEWYQKIKSQINNENWIYHILPGLGQEILSVTKPIYQIKGSTYANKLGFIKFDFFSKKFFKITDKNIDKENASIIILDNEGTAVYKFGNYTSLSPQKNDLKNLTDKQQGLQILDQTGGKHLVVHGSIDNLNYKVLFLFPYNKIEDKVLRISRYMVIMVSIFSLIMIALTFVFFKHISKRINFLIKKIVKVGNGNLEVTDMIEGKDEIGIIDDSFNSMLSKLKTLINENYIQRLEKRETELKALQLQINPHFLYNTLESINSIASVYGCKEIAVMSQKLGEMFRYSINAGKNEFVTLKEEICHIKNYIEIQTIRFDDKFIVFYNIPDILIYSRIIKFILQPIVENAFYHGFENKKGKSVLEISAYMEDQYLYLKIQDDGNGMDIQTLDALNAYINNENYFIINDNKGSIGLKNVNSRIKLTYGEEYGISIKSNLDKGTLVIIKLPAHSH